jgi:hypothetical protein
MKENNLIKEYELIGPDERIYTHEEMSLMQLAKLFKITARCMYSVVSEKIKWYKGFRLLKNKDYCPTLTMDYCLIHEDGTIVSGNNVEKFCKENKLSSTYIRRMIKGAYGKGPKHYKRYVSHKGWKVKIN